MTHRLERPGQELSAIGMTPMVATLRAQCACVGREVITIQTVFDLHTTEEQFIWTMRLQWRDLKTEVEQHIKVPAGAA